MQPTVVLVDDHPMWRATLRMVLESRDAGRVIAEVDDGARAPAVAADSGADVVIMDVDLPSISGIEATRRLIELKPDARVLVLSGNEDREQVLQAVRAGAAGYLVKTADAGEVAAAVGRIHAGEMVFPPHLAQMVLQALREGGPAGVQERESTLTLLLTDVEGSTKLAERLGDAWPTVLVEHRRVLREAYLAHDGVEHGGRGDECVWSFPRARSAVRAAVDGQHALADHDWHGLHDGLRVRVGIHTGEPVKTSEGFEGLDFNRAARIRDIGHGGQVLLSHVTTSLLGGQVPDGVKVRELGAVPIKDFVEPEVVAQLDIDGLPSEFPPLRTRG